MDLLFMLLVALAVVVAVGHGIWVAAAWLFRGGKSRRDRSNFEPTQNEDRAATLRYVKHLRDIGAISDQTHAQITQGIAEESRHTTHSVRQFLARKQEHPAPGQHPLPKPPAPAPKQTHVVGESLSVSLGQPPTLDKVQRSTRR